MAYSAIRNNWSITIDHGHIGSPFRFFARDLCTFGYPQIVLAEAATEREAREMLAIEPAILDWTVPAAHRAPAPLADRWLPIGDSIAQMEG